MVSAVIVLAMAIALASLAYPSIAIPIASTATLANSDTQTNGIISTYPQTLATAFLVPYSTETAWYPGNPICDPASMACTPYPTPTATYVHSESSTSFYESTITSEWSATYTTESTVFSTHTSYQNVPVYAAMGMSYPEFAVAWVLIITVGVLLLFHSRKGIVTEQAQANAPVRSAIAKSTKYCHECGAEISRGSRFCGECGAELG
jgi:hypothetical protein